MLVASSQHDHYRATLPTWMRALGGPLLAILLLAGCRSSDSTGAPSTASAETVPEVAPRPLPLASPLDRPDIEISGLAWHGDTLVVLPQYPSRAAGEDTHQLYGLPRSALRKAVADSPAAPLDPTPIPLNAPSLSERATAYEGCEAVAFDDRRVYLVIEGNAEDNGMEGHLLRGRAAPGLRRVRVPGTEDRHLPQQARLPNMSYESLVLRGDTVITIFEANGARVNATPRAYRFGSTLQPLGGSRFPRWNTASPTRPHSTGRDGSGSSTTSTRATGTSSARPRTPWRSVMDEEPPTGPPPLWSASCSTGTPIGASAAPTGLRSGSSWTKTPPGTGRASSASRRDSSWRPTGSPARFWPISRRPRNERRRTSGTVTAPRWRETMPPGGPPRPPSVCCTHEEPKHGAREPHKSTGRPAPRCGGTTDGWR